MKSVAGWRRWFAEAPDDIRTRQEIEDANGGTFPSAPHKSVARFGNLGFAGDLLPVGTKPGVTPEQLESPGQRYRLAGPNGMSCAEMLSDEYRRPDDEDMNDEVETEEKGFSVIGVHARGRGTYDSNVIGDPARRRQDIERQFFLDGGITYRVRRERDGATGTFRGTGILYDGQGVLQKDPVVAQSRGGEVKAESATLEYSKVQALTDFAKGTIDGLEQMELPEEFIAEIRGRFALQIGELALQ